MANEAQRTEAALRDRVSVGLILFGGAPSSNFERDWHLCVAELAQLTVPSLLLLRSHVFKSSTLYEDSGVVLNKKHFSACEVARDIVVARALLSLANPSIHSVKHRIHCCEVHGWSFLCDVGWMLIECQCFCCPF